MIWCRRVLLSLAALLVCMSADQEDERVGHLNVLRFYRSNFTDLVVGGRRGADGSYSRRRHFWYACQRVGKQARRTCFCAFPVQVLRTGCWGRKRGYRRLSTLSGKALVCMSRGPKPERVVFHSIGRSTSLNEGRWWRFWRRSSVDGGTFSTHASGLGGQKRGPCFYFALSLYFLGCSARGGMGGGCR